jgi:hypothetical protein
MAFAWWTINEGSWLGATLAVWEDIDSSRPRQFPAKAESEFSVCGTGTVCVLVCLKAKSRGASEQARQRGQFPTSNLLAKKRGTTRYKFFSF